MNRTHMFLCLAGVGLLLTGCGTDSGQKALKQGLTAFSEKNYTVAVTRLMRASKRLAGSVPLYYHLGLAHLYQGNLDPAQAAFEAVMELEPEHNQATACLGQIAYLRNDMVLARACLEEALAATAQPEDRSRILASLGLVAMGQEQYDSARLFLLRAQQAERLYAPSYYNLGSLYRDHYNLRVEALDQFELYLRLASKGEHHIEKAANNIKRLRLNIARTEAEQRERIKRDPAKAARLLQEGARLHAEKQPVRAMKEFQKALEADPLTFSAAYGLGMICKSQKRYDEALEAFRRAAQINPGNQESHLEAAELAIRLNRYTEAAKLLNPAIARSPFNPVSADLMARIRYAERRLPEARAYGEFYLSLIAADHKGRQAYEAWVNALPAK